MAKAAQKAPRVQRKGSATLEWPADTVVRRKLADLKEWPGNPKVHPASQVQALAGDMKRVGFTQPIVIDENDFILAGHGRKLAALANGWEDAPTVTLAGLTEAEKIAEVIRDNKRNLDAPFDDVLLKTGLAKLQAAGVELARSGFTAADLAALAKPSDFLADMLSNKNEHNGNDGLTPPARGVAIRFDMLPEDRDTVVAWLSAARDKLGLRTSAEALVALAKKGSK